MRKTIAILLSAVMALSLVVVGTSAAPEGEKITTAAEFLAMKPDGKYYLDADITISASYPDYFTGVFDGNGHTVTVSAPMFQVADGEIKNLTTVGEISSNNAPAAAIVMRTVDKLTLTNVVNKAKISVQGSHAGLYAAGLVCTASTVAADNTAYFDGKLPENKSDAQTNFVNCENYGDISIVIDGVTATSADEATDVAKLEYSGNIKPRAGGLMAVSQDCAFVNCRNDGNVEITGINGAITTSGISGGMCARAALAATFHLTYFINCLNNGDIYSDSYSGGMSGYINGGTGSTGFHYIFGCTNNGTIRGIGYVAGMVGYVWASGSSSYLDLEFCVNTGKLLYGKPADSSGAAPYTYVSGWCAYTNSSSTIFAYNIDLGTRELNEGAVMKNSTICSTSSQDVMNYQMEHNYIIANNGLSAFCGPNSEDNLGKYNNLHTIEEGVSAGLITVIENDADVKSGKIAYIINEAAREYNDGPLTVEDDEREFLNVTIEFYQSIGSDAVPTTIPGDKNYVLLNGDVYVNGEKPAETEPVVTTKEVTTPVEKTTTGPEGTTASPSGDDTTAAPSGDVTTASKTDDKKQGCGGFVGMGVALVAILGTAYVAKKKF